MCLLLRHWGLPVYLPVQKRDWSLTGVYPIVYNYSYIGVEAAVTVLLLNLPAVAAAMERVKRQARQ